MASLPGASLPSTKCDYFSKRFRAGANKARQEQAAHKNESRLSGANTTTTAVELVFGPFGAGVDAPPGFLAANAPAVELPTSLPPRDALKSDAEAAGEDDDLPRHVAGIENDDGQPPFANLKADDGGPPPLMSEKEGDDYEAVPRPPRTCIFPDSNHDDDNSDGDSSSVSGGADVMGRAAEYAAFDDTNNFLNPGGGDEVVLAGGAPMTQHVFFSITAARIRPYNKRLPEASQSMPVVDPSWGCAPPASTLRRCAARCGFP